MSQLRDKHDYRDRERDSERDRGRDRETHTYDDTKSGARSSHSYKQRDSLGESSRYASPSRRSPQRYGSAQGRSLSPVDRSLVNLSKEEFKAQRDRTIEVCREFVHNRCRRSELQCRYAHPPSHVNVKDGKVTCCFDNNKGRCRRINPPCRFFHPPPHLMLDGKQASAAGLFMGVLPPFLANAIAAYTASLQQQYQVKSGALPRGRARAGAASSTIMPAKDKIEVCREFKQHRCTREECRYAHPPPGMNEDIENCVRICMDFVNNKCERDSCRYFHPPPHLLQRIISQFNGYSDRRTHRSSDAAQRSRSRPRDEVERSRSGRSPEEVVKSRSGRSPEEVSRSRSDRSPEEVSRSRSGRSPDKVERSRSRRSPEVERPRLGRTPEEVGRSRSGRSPDETERSRSHHSTDESRQRKPAQQPHRRKRNSSSSSSSSSATAAAAAAAEVKVYDYHHTSLKRSRDRIEEKYDSHSSSKRLRDEAR